MASLGSSLDKSQPLRAQKGASLWQMPSDQGFANLVMASLANESKGAMELSDLCEGEKDDIKELTSLVQGFKKSFGKQVVDLSMKPTESV